MKWLYLIVQVYFYVLWWIVIDIAVFLLIEILLGSIG